MTKTWWKTPMGGSVLSFLKAERWATQVQPTEPLVFWWHTCMTTKIKKMSNTLIFLVFVCVVILCVYFLSSVLWWTLRFLHKIYVVRLYLQLFVRVLMSYLRYLCFFLRIVVSNTYCVVVLFYLSSSCVPHAASLSELSFLAHLANSNVSFWRPSSVNFSHFNHLL
jgi:hypothetical protein